MITMSLLKSEGFQDLYDALELLKTKVPHEDFERFCDLTPDGEKLADMYAEFQKQNVGYDTSFVAFERAVLSSYIAHWLGGDDDEARL